MLCHSVFFLITTRVHIVKFFCHSIRLQLCMSICFPCARNISGAKKLSDTLKIHCDLRVVGA